MADQETINARLPVGTRVKGIKFVYFAAWPGSFGILDQEGILMRHGRDLDRTLVHVDTNTNTTTITTGWQDAAVVQFFNQEVLREVDFDALIYLIDGKWLTFDEAMGL